MEHCEPSLGDIVRRLRSRNEWTLDEMSRATGIPCSTLSKVEHGRLSLTYEKLRELMGRLNISATELFAKTDEETSTRLLARRSVGSLETAPHPRSPGYEQFCLHSELRAKRMHPSILRIFARTLADTGGLARFDGEQFAIVLDGEVVLETEFYSPMLLMPRSSVYLDSTMGHAYLLADGCTSARVLRLGSEVAGS